MNGNATRTPPALIHNLEHNKVLHQRVLFLTVKTRLVPYVEDEERVEIEPIGNGFYRLRVFYGYMEDPEIPRVLENVKAPGFKFDPKDTTYFLGRETIMASKRPGWRFGEKKSSPSSRGMPRARPPTFVCRLIGWSSWVHRWRSNCGRAVGDEN